jgi:hypothetical protein
VLRHQLAVLRRQPPPDIQHHPGGVGVRLHGLDEQIPPDTVERRPDLLPVSRTFRRRCARTRGVCTALRQPFSC